MVTEIHNDIKTWNPWQSKYNVMSFALLLLKIKYNTKTKKPFYVIYANLSTIRNLSTTSKHKPKKW